VVRRLGAMFVFVPLTRLIGEATGFLQNP